ncbi:hypothetical protein X777_01827 [Ooceraea biroi]|uniref:Secreted protein n=1 Tax=Ooceraea biroi TaxID=2015173 RepID=A0A026WNI3_OOCBI|nr:hypothetical protein X777_01827 [Ooceraea biroi]
MLTQLRTIKDAAFFATMIRRCWTMRPLCVCLACHATLARAACLCTRIPDYIMTVRRENDFVHERAVTAKLLESLSGFQAVYSVERMHMLFIYR